jgi:integrase
VKKNLLLDIKPKNGDAVTKLVNQLPGLPTNIRYLDVFYKKVITIKDFNIATECTFNVNGSIETLKFRRFHRNVRPIIKHLIVEWISRGLSPATISLYTTALYKVEYDEFCLIINAGPLNIQMIWSNLLTNESLANNTLNALKGMLFFLAKHELCGWSNSYNEFISKNLVLHFTDKFASIKKGDVFLNSQEEAKIVEYLDNISLHLADDFKIIRNAGLVLCAYQFGMRPVQIASLTMRDIRVWDNLSDGINTVHLTFKTVKQRSKSSSHILLRKIKTEWSPIFTELNKFNLIDELSGDDRIFRLNSAHEVSNVIIDEVGLIIGRKSSATDLRHTAAQRMVDGGASQEELAEFMGHTDITTGLVYFQTSVNQAERVNKALGISPIYQQVVKIAHDKFISKEELNELKGAYQIAGVPHGIPIAGIGGCSSGQPACPFNPVTSCYGCRKFMPIHDVNVHEQVLDDMRSIVGFFNTESKGDQSSPTYLQLQNTINGVQEIIIEIRGSKDA